MTCGDACGWMAAAGSALAFGTFAVPIKSDAARSVDVDPMVFQTYKTLVCFVTSWLILLYGEDFTFTPWGIVSGLFWVPAGIATVYAVKTAGLAIGVGIASSFIVLVSFIWGIFVFGEPIHSKLGASVAIVCLIAGLFGMSYYSSPVPTDSTTNTTTVAMDSTTGYQGIVEHDADAHSDPRTEPSMTSTTRIPSYSDMGALTPMDDAAALSPPRASSHCVDDCDDDVAAHTVDDPSLQYYPSSDVDTVRLWGSGTLIPQRRLGMLSAAFCGIWGGSIMAPMKFCRADTKGTHYLLSFAIGALIVNVALWMLRGALLLWQHSSWRRAVDHLPSFHVRVLWCAGGTSGLLWSIGNFFSLISVFYLGEGVGYPLVQTSILVAGLWGIFYFQEVQGTDRILKWLVSALVTVFGILLLSYEHHKA